MFLLPDFPGRFWITRIFSNVKKAKRVVPLLCHEILKNWPRIRDCFPVSIHGLLSFKFICHTTAKILLQPCLFCRNGMPRSIKWKLIGSHLKTIHKLSSFARNWIQLDHLRSSPRLIATFIRIPSVSSSSSFSCLHTRPSCCRPAFAAGPDRDRMALPEDCQRPLCDRPPTLKKKEGKYKSSPCFGQEMENGNCVVLFEAR